ncbi:hypothetical protein [Luedemannella flava]
MVVLLVSTPAVAFAGSPVGATETPKANVYAIPDGTYHYLHVGDTFTAMVSVRNKGPADAPRVLFTEPGGNGFTFVGWINCEPVGGGQCETALASGATRRVGARLKLTSRTPLEPALGFSVEGVIDPGFVDNHVDFIICVYESGICTRDLPGSASNRFPTAKPTRPTVTKTTPAQRPTVVSTATPSPRSTHTPTASASPSVPPSSAAASMVPAATRGPARTSWATLVGAVAIPPVLLLAGALGWWLRRRRGTPPRHT